MIAKYHQRHPASRADAIFAFGPDQSFFMQIGEHGANYDLPYELSEEMELKKISRIYCLSIISEKDFVVTYKDGDGVPMLWSTVPRTTHVFFHKFLNDNSSSTSFLENLVFNMSTRHEFYARSRYHNDEEDDDKENNDGSASPSSTYSTDIAGNPLRIERCVHRYHVLDGVLHSLLQTLTGVDEQGKTESGYIPGFRPLQVCLGVKRAFVILTSDGFCIYDEKHLARSYPSLLEDLRLAETVDKKIAYVSISPFNADQHFILFKNRTSKFRVGDGDVREMVQEVSRLALESYVGAVTEEMNFDGLSIYSATSASSSSGYADDDDDEGEVTVGYKANGGAKKDSTVPTTAAEHWSRLEAMGIRRDGVWRSEIQGEGFIYREGTFCSKREDEG